uniref:Sex-determining region Y protein n=1 Tax=Mesocestoides corti TaxID=53468 RepID=A0A5K3FG87_MESCO
MWMQECVDCPLAQTSLQSWIRHLTDVHALPTEWPSERAARLTGATASKPYTTITESKKRRRKDSVPRPLNSFMLFAQHIRRNVLRVHNEASNSVLSQQLGIVWRSVPRVVKNRYDDEAAKLVKIHQLEFPNYKYQPKKRSGLGDASSSAPVVASDASPSQKLAASRGYSPEPWQQRCGLTDSAYSSRKNSCASSSASSPQVTEFSSTPVKQLFHPFRRVLFDDQRPHVRQRFASATNGTMTAAAAAPAIPRQARPASCLLNPATARVLKREHEPLKNQQSHDQTPTLYANISVSSSPKRRPISFLSAESSVLSLPELVNMPSHEVTLLGERPWQRGDEEEEDFSYFESATESESILSEENAMFEDSASMMDLADFLPGAEELILGVEPLASGTLSPDLEMLDKNELLKI